MITIVIILFLSSLLFFSPNFLLNHYTSAGWLYLALSSSILNLFFIFHKKTIILPSKKNLFFYSIPAFLFTASSILNNSNFLEEKWIERYILLLFFFATMQALKSIDSLIKALAPSLFLFVIFLLVESGYQHSLYDPKNFLGLSYFSSRMKNSNILAQTLVLCFPIFIFYIKNKNYYYWIGITALFSLMGTIIILSGCRSAMIGLFLYAIYLLFYLSLISKRRILVIMTSIFLMSICLNRNIIFESSQIKLSDPLLEGKKTSSSYRIELWKESWSMGLNNFTGVGVNNFEFGFIPYKRDSKIHLSPWEIDKTPHNEFLRIFIEDGIWCFINIVLIFLWGGLKSIMSLLKKDTSLNNHFFIVMLPEILLQFPSNLAFPMFLTTLIFSSTCHTQKIKFHSVIIVKFIYIIFFLLSLLISLVFIARQTKIIPLKWGQHYCSLFPDNWRVCSDYAIDYLHAGKSLEAGKIIETILKRQPFNYIMLNLDYSFGSEKKRINAYCLYENIFKSQYLMNPVNFFPCPELSNRDALVNSAKQYAQEREKL